MALNEQASNSVADDQPSSVPARQLIDEGRRHFALKQYPSAIDKVTEALEQLRAEHDEDADVLAPVLHLYGRSLLENFILHSAALGGGGASAPQAPPVLAAAPSSSKSAVAAAAVAANPRFSFTGDAEDDEEEEEPAAADDDDDDDLQVAFAVLDLARVIYQGILSKAAQLTTLEGRQWSEVRLKAELAEVMNDLGDVGLESENFHQASADYRTSLEILSPLLNSHSRRLADAHLRLGLALEFHPEVSERQGAKRHVQVASDVLGARIAAIEGRLKLAAQLPTTDEASTRRIVANAQEAQREKLEHEESSRAATNDNAHVESTAESTAESETEKDDLLEMTHQQLERELAEMRQMKAELDIKLDEYETDAGSAKLNGEPDLAALAPGDLPAGSTKEALQQAIKDAFLASADADTSANPFINAAAAASTGPVNNLSSMVKRKKKTSEHQAPAPAPTDSASKKARVEEA